jgi:hypothetical protein
VPLSGSPSRRRAEPVSGRLGHYWATAIARWGGSPRRKLRGVSEETPVPGPAYLTGHMRVESARRGDGYRPICDPLWVWASMLSFPPQSDYRLLLAAARRLDSGHLQLERVRSGLENMPSLGSPAGREVMHEIVGDAELAVIAINRALTIAASLSGRYSVCVPFPKIVDDKRRLISRLRDHYEHVEDRAFGRYKGKPHADALGAFERVPLFRERKFSDGIDSLGIDGEATELLIAARDYIVQVWTELVRRAHMATVSA